jgi:hypothetical protein
MGFSENLSTKRLNVLKNTNQYQAIGRDYFLIIDKESNYLINTKHPDFQQIKIIEIEDFNFDSRIKE